MMIASELLLDQPGPPTRFFTATVRIAPDGTVLEQFLGAR